LKTALDAEGIELSVWCIHRKIGMSGGLFTNQLLREIEVEIDPERIELLRRGHAEAYQRHASEIRPLPGARKPLVWLIQAAIPWAIATSSRKTAAVNLAALTRDQVRYAKPDPDLFLAAAEQLDAPIERAIVVGDSIWDMLAATRCRALGDGLLSGGYGSEELRQTGAIRVYADPADLLNHIDEVGWATISAGQTPCCTARMFLSQAQEAAIGRKGPARPRLRRWNVPADTPPACRTLNLLSDTGSYRWPRLRKLTS
jgi:HAD superfamily hydrolase (TIGR01509 family)